MAWLDRIQWAWVLIGWTLFLWLSRLRNVLNNDELTSNGRAARVAVVVIFVGAAAAVGLALRQKLPASAAARVVAAFLAWTIGYWIIRGVGILVDSDYSVGFKAVHTVLMVVSLTLSALTARQLWLRR